MLFFVFSCDNNNSENCIKLEGNPNALMNFEDCPSDGLVMFCNNYTCNLTQDTTQNLDVTFSPNNCNPIDCFNFECEIEDISTGDNIEIGIFTIEEILQNSNFSGLVTINQEGVFDYICIPSVQ